MNFTTALEDLTSALRRRNLKTTTITQYRDFIGAFAKRMMAQGIGDMRQIHREHIETYQATLLDRKLKPRTVASHIQAVRSLFRHLTDTGQLLCDPTERVVALKWVRSLPRRIVTEDEMRKLLDTPDIRTNHGIRDRALLELLYGTAMRINEALSLDVGDVDVELGQIHLQITKGSKDRTVPTGRAAKKWVEKYQVNARPHWAKSNDNQRRLFLTQHGKPLRIHSVQAMLRRLSIQAKLKPIYPHAIRHAAATHMLRRGADIRMVQRLLGHAHLSTTQQYTKVTVMDVQQTHARTHPLESGE